ncbi:MAG: MFS transporter [Desulfobacteraceae bacterium]|nr:MAG: MFS transporter [Desulfobacteraceae bacterium]
MDKICHATSRRKAALVWTTVAFFAGFAGVSAFGPIVPKLKESMALNPILMGLLVASPALAGSLLRIPFGAIVDRIGGKIPILVLLGLSSLGIAGTTILFVLFPIPEPHHYPLFLSSGVLCGCGIATFSVGIPTVSYWYPQKKQGVVLALYGGLGNLAPGLFSFLLPVVVVSMGFFLSYVLWLILLLIVTTLFFFLMKDAPYFQYKEMGIEIDQEALLIACGEELVPSGNAMASIKKAASDYRTWILTNFYFVSFGGFIALTVWFPTYWIEYFGMTLVQAGILTALYSLSASILRVFGGAASDFLGGEKVASASFLIMITGSVLMILPLRSIALAVVGELLLALGMGFANAAVFKLVPKFMPAAVGGTAGIVGGLGAFGGFVIPVFMGLVVKLVGSSGYPFGFSVFLVLSALSFLLLAFLGKFR